MYNQCTHTNGRSRMFNGVVHTVLALVKQYGYLAVFVYMVLETSFLLHFVPSEVVVPFAAAELVHGPVSFVLFVADATAGSTLGSLVAYVLFGRYGREVLERYGHVVHVSERSLDRSRTVFVRYGESSVFWGRLVPFLRALISIPAGLAEMDLKKFVVYSAGGALLFNTALTYLVYTGSGPTSPLAIALRGARTVLSPEVAYVRTHGWFVGALVVIVLVVALLVWAARGWIRSNPELATLVALHVVRLLGLFVGGAFVLGALSSPRQAFQLITSFWDNPLFFVQIGFSEQIALFLTGVLIAFCGLFAYEVGTLVRLSELGDVLERIVARLRR